MPSEEVVKTQAVRLTELLVYGANTIAPSSDKGDPRCHLLSWSLFTLLSVHRRQLLATTGIAAVTTLAGCSGGEDGGSDGGGGSEGDGSANPMNGSGNDSAESNESGSNASSNADDVLVDQDRESAVEGLEILEHELIEGPNIVSVRGVVLNDTGNTLEYVEVGVITYNADGQRIGDSFTNTTNLPAGEEWAFEVPLTSDADEIADYTIAVTDSPF